MQPAAIAAPELSLKETGVGQRQFGNCRDAQRSELLVCLGADAVNFADR